MALQRARNQQSKSVALSRNYRKRRKACYEDLSSLKTPTFLQSSVLLIVLAISWVGVYAFLLQPGRHPSRPLVARSTQTRVVPTYHQQVATPLFFAANDGGGQSDDEEWKAMLAAFQMYKAAYGNLKVPLRFTVPSLAPWPEKAWGLKLGQRVAAIRSTGKYVHDERRRKVLDDMGFVWRLRAAPSAKEDTKGLTFDQLYSALETYRQHVQNGKGAISIPNNFVVPDCDPWPQNVRGLPLGKRVASMRSKSFLSANPGAKEKLVAIGFQFDGKVAANDARFQLVYDALKRYKEIYGDLLVPQPFVVPENSKDWSEPTWGLRLGARVNAIRSQGTFVNSHPDRRDLLDTLGFVWSPSKSEHGSRRGRRRKEEMDEMAAKTKALEETSTTSTQAGEATPSVDNSLESLFGDSFDFDKESEGVIGGDSEGDSPKWGLEGGRRLEDAARMAEKEAQEAEEYKPPKSLEESLAEAADRAAACGVIEKMDEEKRIVKGKREKNIPWFNDDFGGEFVFDDVVEALTVYRSIHGDFSNLTDGTFVVPSRSDEFSDLDSSFDMLENEDAGSRAAAAMASFEQRRRAATLEADSVYADVEEMENNAELTGVATNAAPALAGSPDDWPEHLGGMTLGDIVERIRDGSLEVKHLAERKQKLDELDFDWGDPKCFIDVPFEKAVCAMYAYYLVRGDMLVYKDFVMPDEDPWPQALAGYELGEAVHRIRELQNFFEAYHTEKVGLLRMIEFAWFPTLALPLDPDAPELSREMESLRRNGHPDYSLMPEMPLAIAEKLFADGPFIETNDYNLHWRKYHNWDYVKDFWYEQGRRDNAFFLRRGGFNQMADEHEAKYGPGLFTKLNETLAVLQTGVENMNTDDRFVLKEKVEFFRQELEECTDVKVRERQDLLEKLDSYLFDLSEGAAGRPSGNENGEEETDLYEYEYVEEEIDVDEEEYEEELIEEEDFEHEVE